MSALISVSEASQRLGLDPSRVRALACSGRLPAVKIGGSWAIDAEAVAERAARRPPPGRPMSADNAWGMIFIASGRDAPWLSPQAGWRLRRALQLEGISSPSRLQRRAASVRELRCHPGEVSHALGDDRICASEVSAAAAHGLELVSGSELDGYIRKANYQRFVAEHALKELGPGERGNCRLRLVEDGCWHLDGPVAPAAAVALDLIEGRDPRSAKAGESLLGQLNQSFRRRQEQDHLS